MLPGLVLTGELAFQRSAKCQRAKVEVNISNDVAQACAQGIVSYVHPHGCNFAFATGFALVSSGPAAYFRSPLAEHDELKRAP
jgi:hypothetical protein